MAAERISLIQAQFSQNKANFAVLRDGSVVKGRVLSKNGDESFTVSLSGQKINVKSESPLKIGDIFSAKVSVKGEVIHLLLVKDGLESGEVLQKFGLQSEISPQVANLLMSLGFEANAESFKILLFMQQLGIKIDVSLAKKMLARYKSNGKAELEKSEIGILLEEKGIKSDDEKVSAIVGKGDGEKRGDNADERQRRDRFLDSLRSLEMTESSAESTLEMTENFDGPSQKMTEDSDSVRKLNEKKGENATPPTLNRFEAVSAVKSYFEEVDRASLMRKTGLLSAFNSVLSKNRENVPLKHWIVLPFEWDFEKSSGNIKFLYDSALKNLQKTIINIKTSDKNKIFVLYYKDSGIDSVDFATDENLSEAKKSALCRELSAMFDFSSSNSEKKISVHFADFEELQGFSPSGEELIFLNGKA